jgi:hypothetical protein
MDDEMLLYAKRGIAREHGLSERDAHRLVGTTAAELHADAKAMAGEVGAGDPTPPPDAVHRSDAACA